MNYRVWGEPAQTHQRQAQRASHRKNRCNQRRRAEQAGTCSYSLLLTLKPSHVHVLVMFREKKALAYLRTPGLKIR